jgi:hypothetical protein
MNKQEKIDFANLYFSSDDIHDDFNILEKAQTLYSSIPDEIDDSIVFRITRTLLRLRGIFPNLKYTREDKLNLVFQAFESLYPSVLCSTRAAYQAISQDIKYNDALKKSADHYGLDFSSINYTVLLNGIDYTLLFNCTNLIELKSVLSSQLNTKTFFDFQTGVEFLILERRFVSIRNFKLLSINKFITEDKLLKKAAKALEVYSSQLNPALEKIYLFCLAFLLLEGSSINKERVFESLKESLTFYNRITVQVRSLIKQFYKINYDNEFLQSIDDLIYSDGLLDIQ